MIIRLGVAVFIVLYSFSAMAGVFQDRLAGTVAEQHSGAKISDVSMGLQVKGIWKSNLPATGPNGQFDFDLRQIFPGVDLKESTITLTFDKEGYDTENMLLDTEVNQIDWDQLKVRLVKLQEIPKISEEQSQKIEKYVSEKGKTLYLLPYQFTEEGDPLKLQLFAQNLLESITAGLKTTLQAAPGVEMDVSIQPIPEVSITSTNIEQHYQLGGYLNALAMISGFGQLLKDDQGKKEIYLKSNYVTIPAVEILRPGKVTINDQFPARFLNSLQLGDQLNKYWGHHTALALCVQEFHRAMNPSKKKDHLQAVKNIILASRSQLSGDNAMLGAEFTRLLETVEKELN